MEILLIEDDPVHRAFFKEVIEGALPECARLHEAEDGLVGERLAHEFAIACVVMDLQMPRRTGVEAARAIWHERPHTSIMFWSKLFAKRTEGASGIEYAIIAAMVAVVIAGLSPTVQSSVRTIFTTITTGLAPTT